MISSKSRPLTGAARFLDSFDTQFSVLGALIIRELHARYGRNNIGFLWFFGEPMLLASVISTLHYLGTSTTERAGIGTFPFTLIGYCVFIIFRNTFNRAESVIEGSRALLYHRMVTPLDIMLSTVVIEFAGCVASLTLLLSVGIMLGIAEFPARPLYLFGAMFLMGFVSLGLALIIAAYTYGAHFLTRLVHPISYFTMPLSGAFFTMTFLPEWARAYMAWNPLMAVFEIARYGQFEVASRDYMYIPYVVGFAAVTNFWGLMMMRNLRAKIHVN